jgi:SAM-dependent methyltransferase
VAQPTARKGAGPLLRYFGRLTASVAAHAPWSWRLFRRPIRRVFDSLAPGWDERTQADSEERLAPIAAALEHIERRPRTALDIGTGTGTGAFFLASRYPEAEVTGIDLSPVMIEKARERAAKRDAQVRFETADIAAYSPPTAFDLVLMLNMPAFFARTAALVAPGGYVVTASETLQRGFGRHGLRTVAAGTFEQATYHVAERPPA